jgi:hypothetical protein
MERAIVSARAKREYVETIYQRYRRAKRAEKRQILDEFCHVAAYHRKAANRLLTGPAPGAVRPPRHRDLRYTAAAIGDAGLVMPALLRLSDAQFDQVDRFVTALRAAGLTPSRTTHQAARTFSGRLQRAGGLLTCLDKQEEAS